MTIPIIVFQVLAVALGVSAMYKAWVNIIATTTAHWISKPVGRWFAWSMLWMTIAATSFAWFGWLL